MTGPFTRCLLQSIEREAIQTGAGRGGGVLNMGAGRGCNQYGRWEGGCNQYGRWEGGCNQYGSGVGRDVINMGAGRGGM